jgi:amino acid permease
MTGPASLPSIDAAANHPFAYVVALAFMVVFSAARVASGTKISVKPESFFNFWMVAYLLVLTFMYMLTTAVALALIVPDGKTPITVIPPSFVWLAGGVFGFFGFDVLLSKLIIGLGETKLDIAAKLQDLLDQAVAATLKKDAG